MRPSFLYLTEVELYTKQLSAENQEQYNRINPTRKRAVASIKALVDTNGIFVLDRVNTPQYVQHGGTTDISHVDYRTEPRVFSEADSMLCTTELYSLCTYLLEQLRHEVKFSEVDITIHFTQIIACASSTATNSPEGIHQDGMDYVLSALVIERENIEGGTSIIFGSDAKTPIFTATLEPGYGLFHPDSNTDLWHVVTPISVSDPAKVGRRTTIGIDFTVVK